MGIKKLRFVLSLILTVVMLLSSMAPFAAASAETVSQDANAVEYYGRAALAELENSTALLYAYDQIVAGINADQETITVYNGVDALYAEDLTTVWDAYVGDHAEHFWVYGSFGYRHYSDGRVVEMMPPYLMTGEALDDAKSAFSQTADAILKGITEDMNDYEKELYLHDKLAACVDYVSGGNAHTAYGALVEGKAVCDGYAKALQYLLQQVGVQSFIVRGASADPSSGTTVGHAWNLVRIDEEYYHTDLTWNDQGENLYHGYFNQTDAVILEDHSITPTEYALPECDAVTAQYFTGKDTYLDTYSVEELGKWMRDEELEVHVYIPGDVSQFVQWYHTEDNVLAIAATAGVQGGFGYGYSLCGRELIVRLSSKFKVTNNTEISYLADISSALTTCNTGSMLRLLADHTGDIAVDKEILLDLNGFDIDGSVAATASVTVYDSETDDYTVANGDGYGKITGEISGIQAEDGYLMVQEGDGTSVHRIDVALNSVGVRSSVAGLYYTGTFAYDEVVARNTKACGVTLSVKNPEPIVDPEDQTSLYTESPKTLLTDIMSATETDETNRLNAKTPIYGRAYLMLTDGTCVYSETHSTKLQTLVETIDRTAWDSLTDAQRNGLADMYQTYRNVMDNWKIENIKKA